MKKTFLLFLVFILSLQLFNVHTMRYVSATNADNIVVYIAMGDSITEANPGFVSIVEKGISADYTINYGVSGITSYQLLTELKTNKYVRDSIVHADIITLDIGSNDIYYQIVQNISYALECEPSIDSINAIITSLQTQFNNSKGFTKLIVGAKLICKAMVVRNAVYNSYKVHESSINYKSNLSAILDELESLSPDAKIYIGNLYNPYVDTDPVMLGSYKVYDIDEIVELWEAKYNAVINEVAGNHKVIDLHSVITSKTQLNGDISMGNWDPHPNSQGHKDIANAFLHAIK